MVPVYCGILPVHKPVGLTSTDILNRLIAALRRVKVRVKLGHGGTLDKTASGLLLVLVGKATRGFNELQRLDKVYRADVRLDAFSATDDSDGPFTPVTVNHPPGRAEVEQALNGFVGLILQQPPSFSRVHAAPGVRSDRLARKANKRGQTTERPAARSVNIYAIDVLAYEWPMLSIRVTCGSGTYIRSLARDLGGRLSTGGYLAGLVRERIGPFAIEEAAMIPSDRPIRPEEAFGWLALLREKPPLAEA